MTPARWAIIWARALRGYRAPIRSKRERRIYARIVLHAFRSQRRLRLAEPVRRAA